MVGYDQSVGREAGELVGPQGDDHSLRRVFCIGLDQGESILMKRKKTEEEVELMFPSI